MAIVTIRTWAKDEAFKVKATKHPRYVDCLMVPRSQMMLAGVARTEGLVEEVDGKGNPHFVINRFFLTEH